MDLPHGKRVFSAAQPSGTLHIGNYLGALKQWVALQDAGNECFFPIVDLHAITVAYDPKQLPEVILRTAAMYLAAGINPTKSAIFIQSHVPAHAEAAWLLTAITPVGELKRMTQYKDKSKKQKTVGAGLLTYPTLMTADIVLYDTDLVPVGEDQLQHVEFARTLARKFNNQFGETLKEPQAHVLKTTARIMSLADPARKMSKSDPVGTYVALLDMPDVIRKKIRSAVTDSGTAVNPRKVGPALKNLLGIYAAFAESTTSEVVRDTTSEVATQFARKGYAVFKDALADLLIEKLAPIRTRADALLHHRAELQRILREGATRATVHANSVLARMKERMGLLS